MFHSDSLNTNNPIFGVAIDEQRPVHQNAGPLYEPLEGRGKPLYASAACVALYGTHGRPSGTNYKLISWKHDRRRRMRF